MEHIFQQINTNTTIVTPNRRLSATLHKLYQAYQLEEKKSHWETPDILPINNWIQRLWHEYANSDFNVKHHQLNSMQEQFIWEDIISHTKENSQLLLASETASMIKSAWHLLKQWQVDINHPAFQAVDNYATFVTWATQFEKKCQEKNWIDSVSLVDFVIEKIKSKKIKPSSTIILVGFNELSPQLKYFLNCCREVGSQVNHIKIDQTPTKLALIQLTNQENEIFTIARWAKATLAKSDNVRIGCVIPSLDKIRDRVMQVFSEVFAAENTYTINPQLCPFNISAGKNLLQYPIINTAIQLLMLHKKNISIEDFSCLLTSPFLGEAETERIKRANFDSLLRQKNVAQVDLPFLLKNNDNKKQLSLLKYIPYFAKRLDNFFTYIENNQKKLPYGEWAKLFSHLLSLLGWPGERSLSSEEYQIVENWLKILSEYTTLDQVTKPVYFQQALQTLQKIAKKSLFQPKTPDAPIQVLGLLEAAALPFDYLWVAGMDDLSWPPQPKPNPFIPKSLQREYQMPHATAERELTYCNELTQQFKQSASEVIFSHAEKEDELELQPSSLIRNIPEMTVDELGLTDYLSPSKKIFQTKKIEKILDEIAPPHFSTEKIDGGIKVIKLQALCPFKAFSECRLHARALETPLPGLHAKDRGNIIHKALELIWNKLQDHTSLISMDEQLLNQLIDDSVNNAINHFSPLNKETHYFSLEKQRLYKLLWNWLEIEKKRSPFKIVDSENEAVIILNQLSLSIRIDRIDELPDGKKLIIDYKTGKYNEINNWFGDRPEEPQLPLYALLDPDNTIGVTFAQLSPGENCFKGISQYSLDTKGIKLLSEVKKATALSWIEQLKQWYAIFSQLSDDFCQGIAKVDPKEPSQTCSKCSLKPFCRIYEEITDHD